jgi:hypothetical protein
VGDHSPYADSILLRLETRRLCRNTPRGRHGSRRARILTGRTRARRVAPDGEVADPDPLADPVVEHGAWVGDVFGEVGVVLGARVPGEVEEGDGLGVVVLGVVVLGVVVPGVVVLVPGVVVLPGIWVDVPV